jgi:hypothetical protein
MALNLIKRTALVLGLGIVGACSSSPENDASGTAPTASAPNANSDTLVVKPVVSCGETCNTMCSAKPGVSGGQCFVGNLCVCDAPTCGMLEQHPCAGDYCSQGHYDAWLNACDSCGTLGATCCDRNDPGATTSCYGGLFCQNGLSCQPCGGDTQQACQPGDQSMAPFCNPGLELAGPADSPVCLTQNQCGFIGELPCSLHPWVPVNQNVPGCRDYDALILPGSPYCQWNPTCGHVGMGCCDAGSIFDSTDGITHDVCDDPNSFCTYSGIPGFGSWQCAAFGGGSSGGNGSCDTEPCAPSTCDNFICCEGSNCCAGTWDPSCDN